MQVTSKVQHFPLCLLRQMGKQGSNLFADWHSGTSLCSPEDDELLGAQCQKVQSFPKLIGELNLVGIIRVTFHNSALHTSP